MTINVLKLQGSITDSRFPSMGKFIDPTPVLPVTAGLVGLYVLNSRADWLKNFANPSLPAVVRGAGVPVRNSQYAELNKAAYLDLGMTVGANWTGLVISRPTDTNLTSTGAIPLTNHAEGDPLLTGGDSLASFAVAATTPNDARCYEATQNSTTGANGTFSKAFVGKDVFKGNEIWGAAFSDVGGNVFYRKPDGTVSYEAFAPVAPNVRKANTVNKLLSGFINGSPAAGAWAGTAKVSLIAVYDRSLTSTEATLVLNYLGVWCNDLGIRLHGA